jgi:moderate conductance mechanosensitive channel
VHAVLAEIDRSSACGPDPSWLCARVYDLTDGNTVLPGLVSTLAHVAFIMLVAWIAAIVARRYFGRLVARLVAPDASVATRQLAKLGDLGGRASSVITDPDPRRTARVDSISAVVGSTTTVIVWTIAVIMALGEVGVNLAPLIAGAGIAGVALGFGAQSLVKDCIAGLFMLLEDQYGIGDVVDLDEAMGTVEKVSLRTTVLRGVDGTVWYVPNGEVQRVGNKSQLWSMALIDVDVAYDCDLAAARRVIIECVEAICASDEWADSVLDPPTLVGVEALGADGITIRVTVKTEPGKQWALQRAIREALKTALDGAGIEIPFPQRTVWVRRPDGNGPDGPIDGDDPLAAAP